MNYKIELFYQKGNYGREISHGLIRGLPDALPGEIWHDEPREPDTWINVASLWRPDGTVSYYGGMVGEGETADSLHDAIHASLYDLYQTRENIHRGDMFECEHDGETMRFLCDGVHVVPIH